MFFNEEASGYPLENIISEYKFQNNTLDTVGSNDGTPTALTYTAGLVGQTGVFDGVTSAVVIADDPSLTFILVPFSVTFLVNFTSTARAFLISKRETASSSAEYQLTYVNGVFSFILYSGGTTASSIRAVHTLTPTLGQWYHITLTYNGGTNLNDIKFYVDGVDVGANDQTGTFTGMGNTTSDVWFGQATFIGSYDFNGDMDCIRFWDKELTSDEVLSIATAELNGIDINP